MVGRASQNGSPCHDGGEEERHGRMRRPGPAVAGARSGSLRPPGDRPHRSPGRAARAVTAWVRCGPGRPRGSPAPAGAWRVLPRWCCHWWGWPVPASHPARGPGAARRLAWPAWDPPPRRELPRPAEPPRRAVRGACSASSSPSGPVARRVDPVGHRQPRVAPTRGRAPHARRRCAALLGHVRPGLRRPHVRDHCRPLRDLGLRLDAAAAPRIRDHLARPSVTLRADVRRRLVIGPEQGPRPERPRAGAFPHPASGDRRSRARRQDPP